MALSLLAVPPTSLAPLVPEMARHARIESPPTCALCSPGISRRWWSIQRADRLVIIHETGRTAGICEIEAQSKAFLKLHASCHWLPLGVSVFVMYSHARLKMRRIVHVRITTTNHTLYQGHFSPYWCEYPQCTLHNLGRATLCQRPRSAELLIITAYLQPMAAYD
jgi:hypothetical protein